MAAPPRVPEPPTGLTASTGDAARYVTTLLITDAEVQGARVDVHIRQGHIDWISPTRTSPAPRASRWPPPSAERTIEAQGGALLPGLHDHHTHLLAMAAAQSSLDVRHGNLDQVIRQAHAVQPAGAWLRLIGYDESVSGPLDRDRLDALAPARPVRVQHRSGAMWVLSSAALHHVFDAGLDARGRDVEPGIERDATHRPTGRLFRLDGWLGARVPRTGPPDLRTVGERLASRGITGVTDATPTNDPADFALLAHAVDDGRLPLRVTVMGGSELVSLEPPPPLHRGPVKVVITDHALPDLDIISRWFRQAHDADRSIAVHCVSEVALVLALAAWDDVGVRPGDRVEHGAVVTPAHAARLAARGLTVVTQPAFVFASGDRYLTEVDPADRPHLYPCGSLRGSGVAVGGSTDAPFGPDDPWQAIATAVDRRTAAGVVLGNDERLDPSGALALFLTDPAWPGGPVRQVDVGTPADLCLLGTSWAEAATDPAHAVVAATFVGGTITFADEPST